MAGMPGRALGFGMVAEAYERFRPGYPAELFDVVMAYAGRPVRAALEIGAGTGKAIRLFAQRGIAVTATEPDGAMLAELRKHVPANVKARLADPVAEEAVRAARAPFLESDEVPSPDGTPAGHDMQWPGTELQRSGWFTDVQQTVIERRVTMSARDYIGHLSTISAYLELPAAEQEQVYSRIMQVLPDGVEIAADITVHLARRRSEQ
jgi:SAM-dependent methyltransferase